MGSLDMVEVMRGFGPDGKVMAHNVVFLTQLSKAESADRGMSCSLALAINEK